MSTSDRTSAVPGWPTADGPRPGIAVVGPNPAMDRTEEIEEFRPHEVNRALVSSPRAGGKSFIVGRALRRLERPVTLYGFLGGTTGQYLREECAKLGIRDSHTSIAGETRINTILVDRRTGGATVINEPGPTVSVPEAARLSTTVGHELRENDILVLSGSLPRGIGDDFYAELIAIAHSRGARSVVDAEGEVLVRAVSAHPWAVKCNLAEFRSIAPDAPHVVATDAERHRLIEAMTAVVASGVRLMIVTLGADGVLAVSESEALHVTAAHVVVKNPTGSGDTFLAAFVAACADGAALADALKYGAAAASANAAVLVPDIGPSPDLAALLERTAVLSLDLGRAPDALGMER